MKVKRKNLIISLIFPAIIIVGFSILCLSFVRQYKNFTF